MKPLDIIKDSLEPENLSSSDCLGLFRLLRQNLPADSVTDVFFNAQGLVAEVTHNEQTYVIKIQPRKTHVD